ncbi:unnamed protein product [Cyprideis torosa]|uniref:Uncharacterized protein n=1 Tax=Cyprideis torosa TaxID=163714 RepID=A0A7R8W656_9CRUS|nr:unnamed protein product [Cyprideis torosa]CAG0886134.1 unnamed protein product [Cyprideis torosa]
MSPEGITLGLSTIALILLPNVSPTPLAENKRFHVPNNREYSKQFSSGLTETTDLEVPSLEIPDTKEYPVFPASQSEREFYANLLQEALQKVHILRLLLSRPPTEAKEMIVNRKRTCLFNGGMSHSCDYKDAINANQQSKYWNSMGSPGRKKRSVVNPMTPRQTSPHAKQLSP